MTGVHPHQLGLLAKLVIGLALVLMVAGTLWHGITAETLGRIWRNLVDRPSGPISFRFVLQPSMAGVAAIYDGLTDARRNRSPYLSTILWNPEKRVGRLREGLNAIARIILLCVVIDAIYQALALNTFHPNEALIVALLLAFLPYVVIRGLVTRVALLVARSRERPLED
jgi:hypothetical protein